ncbi:hypothetical protein PBOR_32030 [Paenibacillus borealis]|uniref:Uncharacterized protein n=1 Tax=Paenibacillus borealis TaxID=160799 RepID=A0A089LHN2_PAEBO|nr:hypothetical protein PBOR_32030 [Paenibacillus borealis]
MPGAFFWHSGNSYTHLLWIRYAQIGGEYLNVLNRPKDVKSSYIVNPSDSAESGQNEEIKGINPFDPAGSGQNEEIKGINPSDPAGRGQYEEIKGIMDLCQESRREPKRFSA